MHVNLTPIDVPFDQNSFQTSIDQIGNQWTVITTNGFYTFTVHFIMPIGFGEVQASISFLVD